jgi:DNA-binding transcriptional ArsR family regulator
MREIRHPSASELDLATILRTVGDPVRLAIVQELLGRGECICTSLNESIDIPASTLSYHLRLLREAGVTRTRAVGTERHVSVRRDDLDRLFPGLLELLAAKKKAASAA